MQTRLRVILMALAALALVVGTTTANTTSNDRSEPSAQTRTFAYHANGRLAGWVRREGPRWWWASNGGNSRIAADRKGGYGIAEGYHTIAYAWPARRDDRNHYVVHDALRGNERTSYTFERVSATRWNVLRAGRLAGFTKGPDGVAAALGYYEWGDDLLPD